MAVQAKAEANNSTRIDVLIPAIDKDLNTLPHVIDSVRRHVRHPIGRIYIVSPESSGIRKLCSRKNCTFVNERTVLPFTKDLIRPHSFMTGNKTAFYCRDWSQPEYFNTYRKLLRSKAPRPRSFVTHYMLFEKTELASLKKKIESIHRLQWYKAIISSINKKKQFGFSEYETYANYMYSSHAERMILRSSKNKSLSKDASSLSNQEIRTLSRRYRSLSFHKRKIYSKAPRA